MNLALVIGTATATVKHPSMTGAKLLVVQPLMADGRSTDGNPLLAVDRLGAGRGERVMLTSDGPTVQSLLKDDKTPVRWSVLGIAD
jgi:ethanolamine utilization protein EutN